MVWAGYELGWAWACPVGFWDVRGLAWPGLGMVLYGYGLT
jgi:hypothetical protein